METSIAVAIIKMITVTNRFFSFFFFFQSLRVKYYKQGDRVSETELAKGLQLLR